MIMLYRNIMCMCVCIAILGGHLGTISTGRRFAPCSMRGAEFPKCRDGHCNAILGGAVGVLTLKNWSNHGV